MKTHPWIRLLHIFWSVGFTVLLVISGNAAVRYLFDSTRSVDYWMEYESVKPIESEIAVGQRPVWESNAVRHRKIDIKWVDTLLCKYDGEASYTIVMPPSASERLGSAPALIGAPEKLQPIGSDYKILPGRWEWDGGIPNRASLCHMRSDIRINPSQFVEKTLTVISESVRYK